MPHSNWHSVVTDDQHTRACIGPANNLIHAETTLVRFVVDLLYNKLYNKHTQKRLPRDGRMRSLLNMPEFLRAQ